MDETEQLSGLVGQIYDASLDPTRWPEALENTCRYVQGISSALVSHDSLKRNAQFYFSWGDDPAYTKSYNEKYVQLNPAILPTTLYGEVGTVCTYLDFIPTDEYRASRFFREWAGPQGYIDGIQATLEKSATSYAAIVVVRHERHGLVDDDTRRRMKMLAPHFRRAVAISKVIDLHKVEAASLADTLDGIAAGMVLVDAAGRIVHANASGLKMLNDGSVVRNAGGKFAAVDPETDRALHDIFINADSGDVALSTKGIAVAMMARNSDRFVAHVLPLTSGARRKAGVAYSAVAAVFVRKAAIDLPHPLETIAVTFNLTAAEMRVLMMIVQVGGVPEVAPVLGISEATVKTHLQRVFAKTETGRQADLVKLVAGYMSPLAG